MAKPTSRSTNPGTPRTSWNSPNVF
jgi:hypothetical protein